MTLTVPSDSTDPAWPDAVTADLHALDERAPAPSWPSTVDSHLADIDAITSDLNTNVTTLLSEVGDVTGTIEGFDNGAVAALFKIEQATGLDVKDFGAVGDGSDDTAAIQSAIASALTMGAVVFFPAGSYWISAPLDISGSGGLSLVGGPGAFIYQQTADTDLFYSSTPFLPSANIVIRNLTLDSVGGGTTDAAMHFIDPNFVTLEDVYVRNFSRLLDSQGITATTAQVSLSNVTMDGSAHSGIKIVNAENILLTGCNMGRDEVSGNTLDGYTFDTCKNLSMINCVATECAGTALSMVACQSIAVMNFLASWSPNFDYVASRGIDVFGCSGVMFAGGRLQNHRTNGLSIGDSDGPVHSVGVVLNGFQVIDPHMGSVSSLSVGDNCEVTILGGDIEGDVIIGPDANIIVIDKHLSHYGVAPSVSAGSAAGTDPPSPQLGEGSTDQRGYFSFGSGTSTTSGEKVALVFATPYERTPMVSITPMFYWTASLDYWATPSTTGISICTTDTTDNQTYDMYGFQYIVMG